MSCANSRLIYDQNTELVWRYIYGVCSETASAIKHGNFSEQALFDVVIDEAA